MSKLWTSILEQLIIIGNHSGCHQLPEHSFFYKDKQFPVCARCTGVFIGEVIAIILLFFKIMPEILISIILLSIMGADWFIQQVKILESTNKRRLITGILGGYAVFNIYAYIIMCFINYAKISGIFNIE